MAANRASPPPYTAPPAHLRIHGHILTAALPWQDSPRIAVEVSIDKLSRGTKRSAYDGSRHARHSGAGHRGILRDGVSRPFAGHRGADVAAAIAPSGATAAGTAFGVRPDYADPRATAARDASAASATAARDVGDAAASRVRHVCASAAASRGRHACASAAATICTWRHAVRPLGYAAVARPGASWSRRLPGGVL